VVAAEVRVRWWVVLPVAAVLSAAGAVADLRFAGSRGVLLAVAYVAGCLLAVVAVRGPGLLAATVEPPAVLLIALAVGEFSTGTGVTKSAAVLDIGARATAEFPLMLAVTGATVVIGLARGWRARRRRSALPAGPPSAWGTT
jgi:hypothetical protein